jgi:hypothetical protein
MQISAMNAWVWYEYVAQYEERFGKIDDGGSQPQQPLWSA